MTADTLIRGLREQIVERLRGEILSGRLTEGTPFREVELSERFGVSRGPIREALQQLTHEGMLVSLRNCGVRVAPDPPDSIRQLVVPIRQTIGSSRCGCLSTTSAERTSPPGKNS